MIAGVESAIADEERRKQVLASLQKLQIEEGVILSLQEVSGMDLAIYEKQEPFGNWPVPPDEVTYDGKLVDYLVDLACLDPDIARGIGRRSTKVHATANLAAALLENDCAALKQLTRAQRAFLRIISQAHPDGFSFPPVIENCVPP